MSSNFLRRSAIFVAAAAAISAFIVLAARVLPARATPQAAPSETIACRILEVHAATNFSVVIFHQRDKQDREKLADFLQTHSDAAVQFQKADGAWHDATLIRLKSCFGRGLLAFPAGAATLAEKDAFTLRLAAK